MTDEERARRLDEATIWLMERTSWRNERDFLIDCGWCGMPFWAHHHRAQYCCPSHEVRASQERHRAAYLERCRRQNARRSALREARAA